MDFMDRVRVWHDTCAFLASDPRARSFPEPATPTKVRYDETKADDGDDDHDHDRRGRRSSLHASRREGAGAAAVENEDCIVVAERLLASGLKPMVLILADHRFAGGDVRSGSGAQEENLFRRTNLSTVLTNAGHGGLYPIREDEAVVCRNVTVFRGPESDGCAMLRAPFQLDFIACPALYHPRLTLEGALEPGDEALLRKKLRLVFESARRNGNDALVLGPMGCGAWRNPPHEVARIMREEAEGGAQRGLAVLRIACLEVDPKAYIVVHRDRPSNYIVFRNVFERL